MRISDWSSDVCSSDLGQPRRLPCSIAGNRRDLSPINGPQFSRAGGNSGRRPRRGSGVNRERNDGGCSAPGGDRKSVVEGKSVSVSVDSSGRRLINKKKYRRTNQNGRKIKE